MSRLRVLGGFNLLLELADAPASGIGPRVLALLTLLVSQHSERISRDKLLACPWPDSDSAPPGTVSNRRSSRCATRWIASRSSAAPAFSAWNARSPTWISGGSNRPWRGKEYVGGRPVWGPFLDGFYVTGLAEFERWVEAKRQRLAHQYSQMLFALAIRADRSGDCQSPITWWRRLAVAEPLSAIPALGLMRALQTAGDPTGALDYGREHVAMVELELGAPASDGIRALMRRLVFQGRTPKRLRRSRMQFLS
jgi:DNA-binding SARP family transcriptional activator